MPESTSFLIILKIITVTLDNSVVTKVSSFNPAVITNLLIFINTTNNPSHNIFFNKNTALGFLNSFNANIAMGAVKSVRTFSLPLKEAADWAKTINNNKQRKSTHV